MSKIAKHSNYSLTVGDVDIKFFNRAYINDLLLLDPAQDTLIYVPNIKLRLDYFSFSPQVLNVKHLTFSKPKIYIHKDSLDHFNYQGFVNTLLKKDVQPKEVKSATIIQNLLIEDGQLHLKLSPKLKDHFYLSRFNSSLSISARDSSSVEIHTLSFEEQSGFKLKNAKALISSTALGTNMQGVELQTTNSILKIQKGIFPKAISRDTMVHLSQVNGDIYLADFAAFLPELNKVLPRLTIHSDMLFSKQDIILNATSVACMNSEIRLHGHIKNYAKYKDLQYACLVDTISTNTEDIIRLSSFMATDTVKRDIGLPYHIGFKGSIKGGLREMHILGTGGALNGNLTVDLNLGLLPQWRVDKVQGVLNSQNLNLSALSYGKIPLDTLNMTIYAQGFVSAPDSALLLRGDIRTLCYNGYKYQNIYIDGTMLDQLFYGNFSFNDPNGQFYFNGSVDFDEEKPLFNFSARAENINLYKLRLSNFYPEGELSFSINTDLVSSKLHNIIGSIHIDKLSFINGQKSLSMDPILIRSVDHSINVSSPDIQGTMTGVYALDIIPQALQNLYTSIFPNTSKFYNANVINQKPNIFCTNLILTRVNSILHVLDLDYIQLDTLVFTSCFDDISESLKAQLDISKLQYKSWGCDKLQAEMHVVDSTMTSTLALNDFNFNYDTKEGASSQFSLNCFAHSDKLKMDALWNNNDSISNCGKISWITTLSRPEEDLVVKSQLDSNTITINNIPYSVLPGAFTLAHKTLSIEQLGLKAQHASIMIDGVSHYNSNDKILLSLDQFDLNFLSKLLNIQQDVELGGKISGQMLVQDIFHTPVASAQIRVDHLEVNEQVFDSLLLSSAWDTLSQKIDLNTLFYRQDELILSSTGYFDPINNKLDLACELSRLRLLFLRKYLDLSLPNIDGYTQGKLRVSGPVNNLVFQGDVLASEGRFEIDYLKSQVLFQDTISFDHEGIIFPKVRLYDTEGHPAILRGRIDHNMFGNMKYMLDIEMFHGFKILNTTILDNKYFYGKAYVTGLASLTGEANRLHLKADIKSHEGSRIYIPLDGRTDVTNSDFIQYVSVNKEDGLLNDEIKQNNTFPLIFTLDLQVDITNDTKMEIIFNRVTGEVLKGSGEGLVNLSYDKNENLGMSGKYTISQGEYLFVFRDILNKRFSIEPGSSINWLTPSPYEASINIEARYNLKTSLASLNPRLIDLSNNNTLMNVSTQLYLTGSLSQPHVEFGILLANADKSIQQAVEDMISTQDEVRKQVAYLLLFHKFYTPEGAKNEQTNTEDSNIAALVTASELLSKQLSSWFSTIHEDLSLGFTYRPATALNETEVEMSMQTQLLSERLLLNGNLGYRDKAATSNTSNIIGDFDLEFKVNKSGTLRLKAYTHSNEDLIIQESPSTQGIGISYRENFNNLYELKQKYKRILTGKKKSQ